ncbi:hypothetical protein F5878DRAFT_710232 [Lentinula raphanica]|uniref:Uncharacterized protein n=1 Tax=Lentinula raphanica TaxID=153919 RepID=A0AA38P8W7_9AGAR|nr:hypothetical protein C8R42DRAFT_656865 [Lentinula raphanica]KAJ3838316.1 hypothetical protein F5878DRAFT_710232 [Lentinula raphanica]
MALPNEIFHSIIEYLPYTPNWDAKPSRIPIQPASPEVIALSVVNWRLRRICLPFLFANIAIRQIKGAKKLEKYLAFFSEFTKALVIDISCWQGIVASFLPPVAGDQIITRILPQLEKLCYVELSNRFSSALLKVILARPTVTSVLVHHLPPQDMHDHDLSKVTLSSQSLGDLNPYPSLERCMEHGMKVARLKVEIHGPLDSERFRSKIYHGLKELRVCTDSSIQPFTTSSWLPALSSTHPTLNEIWFENWRRNDLAFLPPDFMFSFIKESKKQDLRNFFIIQHIGLHKATGQSSHVWYVMGLKLTAVRGYTPLIEIVALIASSFPRLEELTLDLDSNNSKAAYSGDDLVAVLGQFSSLRSLTLRDVFKRLRFERNNFQPVVRRIDSEDTRPVILLVRAKTGILRYALRIAKEVKSLEKIYLDDNGREHGDRNLLWSLLGRLHVVNSNRDIGGTLRRSASGLWLEAHVVLSLRAGREHLSIVGSERDPYKLQPRAERRSSM